MNTLKRAIVTIICAASISMSAFAQDQPEDTSAQQRGSAAVGVVNSIRPRTRMEALINRKGALIAKGYTEIRTIEGANQSAIRVLAVELTDTSRSAREYGVAIEVRSTGQADRVAVAYVDYDEIDGLIAGLDAMQKLDASATRLTSLDASFRTQGDLEIRGVERDGGHVIAVQAVQVYGPATELIWSAALFPTSQLADIVSQLQAAKQALDAVKQPAKSQEK